MAENKRTETMQSEGAILSLNSDEDVDQYFKNIMPTLAAAVKSSNALPSADKYLFFTTFKEFQQLMHVEGSRALTQIAKLLRQNGVRTAGLQSASSDADDRFETLIDANDQLAERISTKLDEAAGIRKAPAVELVVATPDKSGTPKNSSNAASWNSKKDDKQKATPTSYKLLAARFVQRPQIQFTEKVDNSDNPFFPKLKVKPNAKYSLCESLMVQHTDDGTVLPAPNPYEYELKRLKYTEEQLKPAVDPQMPKPIVESSPLIYIDTLEGLNKLCDQLLGVKEIAIDLEAHSYRTFQGLTCLMQLSTRQQDYIIDTLALRNDINRLNLIFTDPHVLKVFHGADSDIEWLQRDFSVYIVNMFDTYQASKALSFSRHSLAYLLKHFCKLEADKQYQLADWRIRPLPQEMLNYAREDTHYLLYVYDMMKNELLEKGNEQGNLLMSVLDKSRQVCSKVYKKPSMSEGLETLYKRSRKTFNNRQMYALSKLYEWRFRLAQSEDESMGYILPNHIMLQICDVLPREPSGILACCTPIPPLVRQHLHTLHSLVKEAREQPLVATSQSIRYEARAQAKATKTLLDCQHDTQPNRPTEMSDPDFQPGIVKAKPRSSWSFIRQSLDTQIAEKVKEIRNAFIDPLINYAPVRFIDYSNLSQQQDDQLKQAMDELDDSTRPDDGSAQPASATNDADDAGKAEAVKKEEVDEMEPLRKRPSSMPQKMMAPPDSNFKPYDYSTADYSEFKAPRVKASRLQNRDKKMRSNKRPENEKSMTFKRR